MAISGNTVWEVRTTGLDTNGGGFVAGTIAPAVDFTQQVAAQISVTDAVANGTSTITSATANFTSAHVGNLIYLVGGSGSLVATRRQVVSVTNATTAAVDSNVASGTGITLNLGGCLASLNALSTAMTPSNLAWVKAGSYSITSTIPLFTQNAGSTSNTIQPTRILGYSSTRGDITLANAATASRPVFTYNATAGGAFLQFSGVGWELGGLSLVNGSTNFGNGIAFANASADVTIWGCKLNGGNGGNAIGIGVGLVLGCEVTNGVSMNAAVQLVYSGVLRGSWIHDFGGKGVYATADCYNNLITNCTGQGIDLFSSTAPSKVVGNTIYKCGGDGIRLEFLHYGATTVFGNILSENSGYGLNCSAGAGSPASPLWDGNAFYNNTSGTRNNLNDTTVNPVNGTGPYSNTYDLTLTADPFVAKASNNFALNTTPGGGAACRKAAPVLYGLGGMISYQDMGALQHQDNSGVPTGGVSKGRLIGGI